MTKDEAQNILEVLAGFSDGFNRLMSADALLSDEDERRKLRRSVGDMFGIMYGEIKSPIYRQFPELAPDREGRLSSQPPAAQEPDSAIVTAEMVHDSRQIIFETWRTLVHQKDGEASELFMRISEPRRADIDWVCEVHIDGQHLNKRIKFYGIDPLQAFQLATRYAFAWIKATEAYKNGEITKIDDGGTDIER